MSIIQIKIGILRSVINWITGKISGGISSSILPQLAGQIKNGFDVAEFALQEVQRTQDIIKSVSIDVMPYPPDDVSFVFGGEATLSWASGEGNSIAGHKVYKSVDGGAYTQVGADVVLPTLELVDGDVKAGHTYRYKVTAYNGSGESVASHEAKLIT